MFKTTHCPYLVDLFDSPKVKRVTLRKGTSVGYSTTLEAEAHRLMGFTRGQSPFVGPPEAEVVQMLRDA